MTSSTPITRWLKPPASFYEFGREERNAVAVLFGLLLRPGNLQAFAELLSWRPPDLEHAEVSVEWTYLRDLWATHAVTAQGAHGGREVILDVLDPSDRERLAALPLLDFNAHYGAVPRPSTRFVQSPSNWSIPRFADNIADSDELRRTCIFKWAFNVKPDLVLQTPAGHVLCIEAKWDSNEGMYPSNDREKALFQARGILPVSQTTVQRYLVNDLLGFNGTHAYLARRHAVTSLGDTRLWADVLGALDLTGLPAYLRAWCEREAVAPPAAETADMSADDPQV